MYWGVPPERSESHRRISNTHYFIERQRQAQSLRFFPIFIPSSFPITLLNCYVLCLYWYIDKWTISLDFQFFNQFRWVPWDDAIVKSAGTLRKLWDSPSKLRSSLCETRLKRTVLGPSIACQNYAVYPVFPSDMTSQSKITQFNLECRRP
jgi:hypothetical protein